MAADILMFKAHQVPAGRDQIQHIEMARDIAQSFNHLYGEQLVLPEALIEASVATLPGLDGRKMSKSYDNTIALFAPREHLRKQIAGIVTDSRAPDEAKICEGSALFEIYQAFASEAETAALRQAFADGIAWGDAKQILFERIDREVAPMRESYLAFMGNPGQLEDILQAGAVKARRLATPFMASLRQSVGLRKLGSQSAARSAKPAKASVASLKQYREKDGLFYFKLVDPRGRLLLQSLSYESPRQAAEAIALLQTQGAAALSTISAQIQQIDGVSPDEVAQALAQIA
jgi:tryptophanyl-tRNA synthetase